MVFPLVITVAPGGIFTPSRADLRDLVALITTTALWIGGVFVPLISMPPTRAMDFSAGNCAYVATAGESSGLEGSTDKDVESHIFDCAAKATKRQGEYDMRAVI